MVDLLAIGLRALAYAAALQTAGIVLFRWLFEAQLDRSARPVAALAVWSAGAGMLLTLAHIVVEPARLVGEISGMFDGSLQALLLASDFGTAGGIRLLGIALACSGSLIASRAGAAMAMIGATLIAVSFTFMGHTAADDQRWLLALLLLLHLFAVAFWLGAFGPLLLATRHEAAVMAGRLVQEFSRRAIRLVPLVLIAGIALAWLLLPGLSSLTTDYGKLLLLKSVGFAVLMLLAAANKWRFGPLIARGDSDGLRAFRRTVLAEWFLVVSIIAVSAAMTGLFSPEH